MPVSVVPQRAVVALALSGLLVLPALLVTPPVPAAVLALFVALFVALAVTVPTARLGEAREAAGSEG